MMNELLEQYAAALVESGDYRVLRRLEEKLEYDPDDSIPTRVGIIADSETTGTEDDCEVIELALLKFTFDHTGRIHRVIDSFDRFRQPERAEISPEISRLTNITQEMVAGQRIDAAEVEAFVEDAVVVVAHNANFDRVHLEKLFPVFKRLHWACSLKEIDWSAEGFSSARLGDLLAAQGFYHSGHRADADCHALLSLLSRPLQISGKLAMDALLARARIPTFMVIVENTHKAGTFLKKRGFRWHADPDGMNMSWRLELSEFRARHEVDVISEEFPGVRITVRRVTSATRHSARA